LNTSFKDARNTTRETDKINSLLVKSSVKLGILASLKIIVSIILLLLHSKAACKVLLLRHRLLLLVLAGVVRCALVESRATERPSTRLLVSHWTDERLLSGPVLCVVHLVLGIAVPHGVQVLRRRPILVLEALRPRHMRARDGVRRERWVEDVANERRRRQRADLVDVRVDARDVWRHHELDIKALLLLPV